MSNPYTPDNSVTILPPCYYPGAWACCQRLFQRTQEIQNVISRQWDGLKWKETSSCQERKGLPNLPERLWMLIVLFQTGGWLRGPESQRWGSTECGSCTFLFPQLYEKGKMGYDKGQKCFKHWAGPQIAIQANRQHPQDHPTGRPARTQTPTCLILLFIKHRAPTIPAARRKVQEEKSN